MVAPTVVLDSCSDGALTDCWLCMKCRLTVHCLFRIKNGIEKTIAELREDPNIGAEVRNQEFTDCTDGFESQFLLIVFLHGLIWRIVAYLAMRFLNSEKKK